MKPRFFASAWNQSSMVSVSLSSAVDVFTVLVYLVVVPLLVFFLLKDKIEIITGSQAQPSRDRLRPRLGYLAGGRSRAKVRNWFRQQDRDQHMRQGRDVLDRELARRNSLILALYLLILLVVIFIITAVSNGANLTDGIDGLAAGSSAVIVLTLAIFAWISGNIIFADYLNVMYIPESGEMTIFISAFVGGLVGFLWYNTYPAQVFMGDTGSLTIGAVIAVLALSVRKEFLIPILAGIFLAENLSVVLQVSYFKYTKKKFGEGRRIFLMSPLHHHYQKKGYHESKIVTRFWIVGIMLAVISILTLKVR